MAQTTEEICAGFAALHLPRWAELPDLALYMDQVLSLMERYLGAYPGFDKRGLTASMVNNYVKQGVLPPPVRKKYDREHLAHLIMICVLKASMPIAAIQRLTAAELQRSSLPALYDGFCGLFESTGAAVCAAVQQPPEEDASPLRPIYCAALRAQAEQAIALRLLDEALPQDG